MTTAINVGAALVSLACVAYAFVCKLDCRKSQQAADDAADYAHEQANYTFELTKSLKRQR